MNSSLQLPEVHFSDYDGVRCLHLGQTDWVQGTMWLDKPFDIELEYVRRMMAWLYFVDAAAVPHLQAMQLGLGAATLTKFCYKKLGMKTTAVELNPQVVAACRNCFKLPQDDERLKVILADARDEIARHVGQIDVLQVDLYDHEAAAPVLDSSDFYASCCDALTPGGVMTVNLFGRNASYSQSLKKIAQAFGCEAIWAFSPTKEGNTVVLAQRQPSRLDRDTLQARAQTIESRWGLPAKKWLRIFKPVL